MKKLSDIVYKVHTVALVGNTDIDITDVQIDSRKVQPGSLFIAVKGFASDGHRFIDTAIQKGAVAIICDQMPGAQDEGITYIQTANSAEAAGQIAHNFYDQPTQKLKLVGVTGTNGKTTIATLLYKLFDCLCYTSGLISTVDNVIAGEIIPSTHTTPDPALRRAKALQKGPPSC